MIFLHQFETLRLLVSGRPPYDSDSIPDLMRRHMEGNPERLPGIPDGLWELITSCMSIKPRLRPPAAEMVAELSDAAGRYRDVPALPKPDRPGRSEIDPEKSDLADAGMDVGRCDALNLVRGAYRRSQPRQRFAPRHRADEQGVRGQ